MDRVPVSSDAFLRHVLNSLPASIVVVDAAGTIRMANQAWDEFADRNGGKPAEVSVGANYLEVCRRATAAGSTDACRALEALEAVQTGQMNQAVLEYPCNSPDEPRWFVMHACRLQESGAGLVVSHSNITARKQAEELTRISEERFRAVFQNAAVGIALINSEGWFEQCNPAYCHLVGYSQDALMQLRFTTLIQSDDRAANLVGLDRLKRNELPAFEVQNRLIRKDGRPVWVRQFISLLKDREGRPAHLLVLVTDITERRQLEEVLRASHQRKDEFLAMLGHELRNPLAPLRNANEVFKRFELREPELHWAQQVIERQVKHLARLVDDLLEVSRISRGKIALKVERMALATVLERAVEACVPVLDLKNQQLIAGRPWPRCWIEGDEVRLVQVFTNLLNNAAKYSDEGKRVWIDAEPLEREVAIHIKDEGIGIAPHLLPHVFELFTQAECSMDRSQGGLGIGLSLVRRLIEMHGGRVTVASAGHGKGSEFTIWLRTI